MTSTRISQHSLPRSRVGRHFRCWTLVVDPAVTSATFGRWDTSRGPRRGARFVAMARAHSGCEVLHQDFLAMRCRRPLRRHFCQCLAVPRADPGIAACPAGTPLPEPRGVLFTSNPRGNNQEGWTTVATGAFSIPRPGGPRRRRRLCRTRHYYRPPGLPRERQPWLATVWRK